MTNDWYYASHHQQKGPVTAVEMLALEQAGHLLPATLVWRPGLPNWQPWSSVAAGVLAAVGAGRSGGGLVSGLPAAEVAVCAHSGQTRPVSLMMKHGDRWVALEHKEAFLRSLRAGSPAAGPVGEGALSYAGFWWRALGFIIDSCVLLVPNMLLAIPYFYLTMTRGKPVDSMESFMMMDGLMVVAYLGSMLGGLLVALTYETWMIAAFGATLGKMAIGVRVVKPGGERLTYGQAFGRYSAKLVTMLVWLAPAYAALFIGMYISYISFGGGPQEGEEGAAAGNPLGLVVGAAVMLIWFFVGGFGYYMAGWTEKKQTLHDKLAKTVVINKTPV